MEDTLSEVFTQCWTRLLYGSVITDNAFRTGVLGLQYNNEVSLRTVVLRAIEPDEKQVVFYTDSRSAKMEQLKNNAQASWLFYDAVEKVQVRLSGEVAIHQNDEFAQYHWSKVHGSGRKAYMAIPGPSTDVEQPADGLAYINEDTDMESGYQNFAVIATKANFIEWLSLKDSGHRRAQFRLIDGNWKGQWLIP